MQILWIIVTVLGHALMIATAALLLPRARGAAPWLMLVSAIASLLTSVGSQILYMNIDWSKSGSQQLPMLFSAASTCFWLLYLCGVLMLAFQHRSLLSRLGELETILRDLSSRNS